jgi:hypothetical protein
LSRTEAERHYGTEFDSIAEVKRVQRLEQRYGPRVHQWLSEGVPYEAMGRPRAIQRFRARRETPVPWNVEHQNRASLQRNRTTNASRAGKTQVPDSVRDVLTSPGRSLEIPVRRTMETQMRDDFADVRIHTGVQAARACEDIDARAFTVGNHVAFNRGEYDPDSREGKHVLAHELAHVRQQTGGVVSLLPKETAELVIDPDPKLEREAEATAKRVVDGAEVGIRRLAGSSVYIQRTKAPRDKKGRFKRKNRKEYPSKRYGRKKRPNYLKPQIRKVWKNAKSGLDGKVRDPNTGAVLTWNAVGPRGWHMGHKPGREYRYLVEYYLRGRISEQTFINEYQNPDHYHPEDPSANMGGTYEGEGEYWAKKWGKIKIK